MGMAARQYTGRLATVFRWLDGVTDKDLMKGVGIVTLIAVFSAATAYVASTKIVIPELAGMGGVLGAATTIGAVLGTYIGWALTTLIYHAAAHILGGSGDRNRMFALTAYASIPTLAQQILRFLGYWLRGITPLTTTNIVELLVDYFNVFTIIGLVLVGVAVMVNYGLTARKAAVVALIPTLLSLALGLYSLRMVNAAAQASPGGLFGFRRPG